MKEIPERILEAVSIIGNRSPLAMNVLITYADAFLLLVEQGKIRKLPIRKEN